MVEGVYTNLRWTFSHLTALSAPVEKNLPAQCSSVLVTREDSHSLSLVTNPLIMSSPDAHAVNIHFIELANGLGGNSIQIKWLVKHLGNH